MRGRHCGQRADAAIEDMGWNASRVVVALLLLLGACREQRPPAPTAEQSQQLNDAERMLDNMASNEEGPEQSPGPSNSNN